MGSYAVRWKGEKNSMPEKSRLDWFKLDCQDDDKLELIEAEFGLTGYAVIIKLWKKIYGGEGYYCNWNNDVSLLVARRLGITANALNEIVIAAIKRGIFDWGMYDRHSILTSHGIQKRYTEAIERRKCEKIKPEYLLLKCAQKSDNADISSPNVDISKQIREDKIREDKIRKEKKKTPASGLLGIVKEYTDDDKLREALEGFIELRKLLKKPLTERALKTSLSKLDTLGETNEQKCAVVDQTIEHSWQSFYPLKDIKENEVKTKDGGSQSYDLGKWHEMADSIDFDKMTFGGKE